jgi:hypothetical protein
MGIIKDFKDFITQKITSLSGGVNRETENPADKSDYSFMINDPSAINKFYIKQFDVLYNGVSGEILDFYSAANIKSYLKDIIYFRNCENYFWSKSANEKKFKRTHSGVPRAIAKTVMNIVGTPEITSTDKDTQNKINSIIKENMISERITDEQGVLTFVEGWGAYRIDYDANTSEVPIIRYFDANNTWFVKDGAMYKAIITSNYYDRVVEKTTKKIVVFDTRYIERDENGNKTSVIDQDAFYVEPDDRLEFLDDTEIQKLEIPGFSRHTEIDIPFILAVPSVFEASRDTSKGIFGISFFTSKVDIFDDIDQALSISATTIRRSAPSTIYPSDSLSTDKEGNAKVPDDFDKDYLITPSAIDGSGVQTSLVAPTVIQPTLNIKNYLDEIEEKKRAAIEGILSPNDFGLKSDTRADSGSAIRERSRQTLFTRERISNKEQNILETLLKRAVAFWDYIEGKKKTEKDYDISVRFSAFSSPSTEQKVSTWLPVFASGAMSAERFVEEIYGDQMSKEEKEQEVIRIKEAKESNTLSTKMFDKIGEGEATEQAGANEENKKSQQKPQ